MRKPSYCWAFFWSKNGLDKNIMGVSACGFLGFPYSAMATVEKDAPEAEPGAWSSAMLPIGGVVLFVLILILSVQN